MLIGGSYYSDKSRSRSRSYSSYCSRSSMRSRSRSSSYSRSPSPGKSNGHSYRYVEVRESDCGQLHGGTIYYTVCSSHTHTHTHTHTRTRTPVLLFCCRIPTTRPRKGEPRESHLYGCSATAPDSGLYICGQPGHHG